MNISAMSFAANYTSLNPSRNVNAAGNAQSTASGGGAQGSVTQASPSGGGAPSGGASQASSASGSSSSSSSGSTSGASALYDPKDLNQDGIVTYAEEMQYALTHATAVQQNQSAGIQAYNQQSQTTSAEGMTQNTLNVYA